MTVAPATRFAAELLGALAGVGVTDIVVCPGARSQALALVASSLEEHGDIRVHVRIDERSAGFLALGLAVESGVPAVVITTSGSAVANLLPAVVEAHHARVGMILLTADRPAWLRGTGANQTTMQPGMFGSFVSWSVDIDPPGAKAKRDVEMDARGIAVRSRAEAHRSPVHVNLQFVEPLSSPIDKRVLSLATSARTEVMRVQNSAQPHGSSVAHREVSPGSRTVVIAGADAGAGAEALAHEGGWPLLAEVSSGARFGRELIVNYRQLLDEEEFGGQIDRVIAYGHPTLSRQVPALLARDDVDVVPIDVDTVASLARDNSGHDPDWLRTWLRRDREITDQRHERLAAESPALRAPDVEASRSTNPADRRSFLEGELAAARTPVSRELLVDAVWRATWPHDRLVFGASRLIRVADATVPGKNIRVHANRGLSGIDGTIATATGIALAAAPARTRVVLGDLATLHDVGSMLFAPDEARPAIQLIVGNDGGGTMFDLLEVSALADAQVFDRVMYTPQNVDFHALAKAFGWHYKRVQTMSDLDGALIAALEGPELVEVVLAR